MNVTREDEADIVCALEGFAWVQSVYALPPNDDPDAYSFAVVFASHDISRLVETHYALVSATAGRGLPGRVLYVDESAHASPIAHPSWRRLSVGPPERATARARIKSRKAKTETVEAEDRRAMELAFQAIVDQAMRDTPDTHVPTDRPYRAFAASFGATPILEVVADPFPSPRRSRVLVIDEDPTTARRIASLSDVDVVEVDNGWSAIDQLTKGDVDLAVCALSIGGFSGAKIHKLVATERPEMARRIVFLASETAVAQAPPSSASGRVLRRPIDVSALRSLLERLESRA